MQTTDRDAQIAVDTDLPQISIVREFDAPGGQVFRAHTDPELFVRWIGPEDLASEVDRWDCRPGGEWRYVSRRAGEEHWFRGCFHEVRGHDLIVQTFSYEPYPDAVLLEKLHLEDLPGGRCRLTATSLAASFDERDAMVSSGMESGVQQGYRKLDALLRTG